MINYISRNQVEFTIPSVNNIPSVTGSSIFLSSIQHIFGGVLNKTWNKLYFHSDSKFGSLKDDDAFDALTYADALTMVHCLSRQIQFLYDKKFVFVGLDVADIFVNEDRSMFFIANFRNLIPVDHEFMSPFYKPRFISEEIRMVSKIPWKMNESFKPYYCLGSLVIHLLQLDGLNSIRYTKLYWVLDQCLNSNKIVFL